MVQALMQRCCAGLKDVRYGRAWLQASILFALTWTIGGALESESQIKFDTFIRSLLSGTLAHGVNLKWSSIHCNTFA